MTAGAEIRRISGGARAHAVVGSLSEPMPPAWAPTAHDNVLCHARLNDGQQVHNHPSALLAQA